MTKKRIAISLDPQLVEDLDKLALRITQQRGKVCEKSEIITIALTAFLVGFEKENKPETRKEELN